MKAKICFDLLSLETQTERNGDKNQYKESQTHT